MWRTVGGRRVFIRDGQSLDDAMKESGKFKAEPKAKSGNAKGWTKDEIRAIAEQHEDEWEEFEVIGIRTQDVPFEFGEIDHKSRSYSEDDGWDNGELDGLSVTDINSDAIKDHISGAYYGKYTAIIGGEKGNADTINDEGELVVKDAKVLYVFPNKKPENIKISEKKSQDGKTAEPPQAPEKPKPNKEYLDRYNAYYRKLELKYKNPYADMTDKEMDQLTDLERKMWNK